LADGAWTSRLDLMVSATHRHNEPVARELPGLETGIDSEELV